MAIVMSNHTQYRINKLSVARVACLAGGAGLLLANPAAMPVTSSAAANSGVASSSLTILAQASDGAAIRFGTGDVATTVEAILDLAPDLTGFYRGEEDALPKAKAQLADIREMLDSHIDADFILRANQFSDRKMKRIARRAEMFAERDANTIMRVNIEALEKGTNRGPVLGQYANMLFAAERLRQLQRIYPDSTKIAAALTKTAPRVASLGSFGDVEKQVEANEEAAAASRYLATARQFNSQLARTFARSVEGSAFTQKNYGKLKVIRTNLIDSSWTVERNAVTGVIISRYQRASMGIKAGDGKCHAVQALFEQKATGGGGYGRIYLRSHRGARMLCENIRP
ncbi:MAG: hypothetical protein AAF559_05020 [Pseudomonadota bacterium]